MIFHVKDPATDKAVRRLAKLKGKTLMETIREGVEKEYKRERERRTLDERLEELAQRFEKLPKSGLEADKAFYDALSGD